MKKNGKSLSRDLEAVVIPLYMILIGFVILLGVALVAWVMGVFFALVGGMLIFLGALFVLQILPPRGWIGIVVGLIPVAVGLLIMFALG